MRPDILGLLASRLSHGSVVVSATNGKTTTSRMLSAMLHGGRLPLVHNRSGANMLSGLTSVLVDDCDVRGQPRASRGLFEVDEATLPSALLEIQPRLLVLMNLFRDQLDRYGELNSIAARWETDINHLAPSAHLVLNADDPLIAALGRNAPCQVSYFGVDDTSVGRDLLEHTADSAYCHCGHALSYSRVFYGHIGIYHCPACGWTRPQPHVRISKIVSQGMEGVVAEVDFDGVCHLFHLGLPGLYNVYNALAASAAALRCDVDPVTILGALSRFRPAFGRAERVDAGGRQLILWLVKNPTGFNESLHAVLSSQDNKGVAFFINDNVADGKDVSWLWDVEFEDVTERQATIPWLLTSGTRAADMAVRLKYAGTDVTKLTIEPDALRALSTMRRGAPAGLPVYCFATYTAMLELRKHLEEAGWVGPMRSD
jgi:UDP-N-acetylmuramyl tripeptide synthase